MAVWKGGRGVKAPYETTHVRVPIPIKDKVESLIENFKSGSSENTVDMPDFDFAVDEARRILRRKKSAKISLESLLTAIYGRSVSLSD